MEEKRPLLSPNRLRTLASTLMYPGGNTLLHELVKANLNQNPSQSASYTRLILLSMSGVDVNAVNDERCTALHLAVMKGNLPVVRLMLTCLPDIDVDKVLISPIPMSALHLAVESHDLPMVQELLEKGADVNNAFINGHTPIEVAIKKGHLDTLRLILDRASVINVDNLLLFAARWSCSIDIGQILLEKGANVNAKDVYGYSPLQIAAENGNLVLVSLLVSRGAANHHASIPIYSSHQHVLRFLLDRGVNVDIVKSFEKAYFFKRSDTVRFLVEENWVDVNIRDKYGHSLLHLASMSNDLLLTRLLIEKGADMNQVNGFGSTPLHHAAATKNLHILEALLDGGADRNARDMFGNTPFDVAGNAECRRILQHH